MANNNSRKQMASLSINGKLYPLYEGINPIGRAKDATVILKDATVSQQHALITVVNEDKHFLSDFYSSNGTKIRDNRLNSFLLYELADNDIIYFANCEAVFRKIISMTPTVDTGESQRLSDSFYMAPTQAVEACFEDDYDFSEVAIPLEHTSISSESTFTVPIHNLPAQPSCSKHTSKANVSIYEQPTQAFVLNKETAPIHDLPTQDISINDVPTQIIDYEELAREMHSLSSGKAKMNDSVVKAASAAASPLVHGIHSLATQKLEANESVVDVDTSTVGDPSFDVIEETVLDDSGLDVTGQSANTPEGTQSPLHVSQLQRRNAKPDFDDSDSDSSDIVSGKKKAKPLPDLESQSLDKKGSDSPDIVPGKKKAKPLPDLESQSSDKKDSQSSDILPSKKKVKVLPELTQDKKIDSGSDTDIEDLEVVKPTTSKERCEIVKAPKEDSGSDTEIDEVDIEVVKKAEIKQLEAKPGTSKDDSDTDIVDEAEIKSSGVEPGPSKQKGVEALKDDSDTDIDEAEVKSASVKPGRSKEKETASKEDSDTDIDEADSSNKINNSENKENIKPAKPPANEDSGSDTDMDEGELEMNKVAVVAIASAKTQHKMSYLDDSDIIPPTQQSDSDNESDDFNFLPAGNSTVTETRKEQVFDVSQTLKEMDTFVTPQNSEEIHLGLSEVDSTENAEETGNDKAQEETAESIFNQLTRKIPAGTSNTEKYDSIFDQPTQNIAASSKDTAQDIYDQPIQKIGPSVQDEDKDDIFDQPTQKVTENEKEVDRDGFVMPHKVPSRKSGHQSSADYLYMQLPQPFSVNTDDSVFDGPTQKYEVTDAQRVEAAELTRHILQKQNGSDQDIFIQPLEPADDDIFLQPTQALTVQNSPPKTNEPDDDIFMQPTQAITSVEAESAEAVVQNKPPEDIFDQPTQVVDTAEAVVQDKPPEDIFEQPTQVVDTATTAVVQDKPPEDIFDQPTQVVDTATAVVRDKPPEDIFDQPTQVVETAEDKPLEDVFDQPTQAVENKQKPKFEEVESQLEVMFASQNVRVTSEATSRPPNPVVQILEEEEEPLSSAELEYCQRSTLPMDEVVEPQDEVREEKTRKEAEDSETKGPEKTARSRRGAKGAQEPSGSRNEPEPEKPTRSRRGAKTAEEPSGSKNKDLEMNNDDGKVVEPEKPTRSRRGTKTAEEPSDSKNKDLEMNKDGKIVEPEKATRSRRGAKTAEEPSGSKNKDLEINNEEAGKIVEPEKATRSRRVVRGAQDPTSSANEEQDSEAGIGKVEPEKTARSRRGTKTTEASSLKNDLEMNNDGDEPQKATRSRKGARGVYEPSGLRNEEEINADVVVDKITEREKASRSRRGTKSVREPPSSRNAKQEHDELEEVNDVEIKRSKITKRSLRNISTVSVEDASTSKSKELDEDAGKTPTTRNTRNKSTKATQEEAISINLSENDKVEVDRTKDTVVEKVVKRNTRKHSVKVESENDAKAEASTSSKAKTEDNLKNVSEELVIESSTRSKRIAIRKVKAELEEVAATTSKRATRGVNKQNMKKDEENEPEIASKAVSKATARKTDINKRNITEGEVSDQETASETSEDALKAPVRKTRSKEANEDESAPKTPSRNRKKKASDDVEDTPKSPKSRRTKRFQSPQDKTEEPSTSEILSTPSTSGTRKTVVIPAPNKRSRSKRLLSTDSEDSAKLSAKKSKQEDESSSSEKEFTVSSRSRSLLNVTLGTPERNRRTLKPKVVFTMINSPELDALESVVRSLGGMVVDTVEACTVLVTSALRRSQKLLSAVGQSKAICSVSWLKECKKVHKFLDPWDYILHDKEAEAKWALSLKESLNRSQSKRLLEGYTVLLTVSEAVDVLKAGIHCTFLAAVDSCGGKCVTRAPAKSTDTNLVVIGNPKKKTSYSKYLKQNVTVATPEAIFDGVLRQEMRWKDHILI